MVILIKKFKLFFMLFLFFPVTGYSQLRHIDGINMGGIFYATSPNSNTFGFTYQKYLYNFLSLKGNFSFENVHYNLSTYNDYTVNPEILYTALSDKKNVFINLKGGILLGIESLNSPMFNQKFNNVFFGESLGLNGEFYITSKIKIDLDFEQRFLQNSKIATERYLFKFTISKNI
jgi:hypothetical protein